MDVSRIVVAVAGDSISAGSPLWDPDPAVRARIATPDERSQWQWWAAQADPRLEFRTTAVYGERTDEIARRLDLVLEGADVLVVQGGINDLVQGCLAEEAALNIAAMLERGRAAGLALAVTDVLPWNNGDDRTAVDIVRSTSCSGCSALRCSRSTTRSRIPPIRPACAKA